MESLLNIEKAIDETMVDRFLADLITLFMRREYRRDQ
jgi:hypothetical protein